MMVFSNGRWIIPLAAWLAPLFMIRFLRTSKAVPGLVCGALVSVVAGMISFYAMIPVPGMVYYPVAGSIALLFFVPFVVDRLLANKQTDRIYLVRENGVIECIRAAEARWPTLHLPLPEVLPSEEPPATGEEAPTAAPEEPLAESTAPEDPFAVPADEEPLDEEPNPFAAEAEMAAPEAAEEEDPFATGDDDPFAAGDDEDPFATDDEDPFG